MSNVQSSRVRTTALVLVTSSCAWLPFIAHAQVNASLLSGQERLEELKVQFIADKARIKSVASSTFDKLIGTIASDTNVSPSERVSLRERWRKERAEFLSEEFLVIQADWAHIAYDYGIAINKAYAPVARKYAEVTLNAINLKQLDTADSIIEDKRHFESQHLGGRKEFVNGSRWEGSRFFKDLSARSHAFTITSVNADVFTLISENDFQVSGHWAQDVSGKLDGISFTGNVTRNRVGSSKVKSFSGIILGRVMVIKANGAPGSTGSYVVLNKKR